MVALRQARKELEDKLQFQLALVEADLDDKEAILKLSDEFNLEISGKQNAFHRSNVPLNNSAKQLPNANNM